MREAPHFRAAPAPSEEEAAAIAAALSMLMEEEAAAVAAAAPRPDTGGPTLPGWVAEGRSVVARRGTEEFRHLLEPGRAWKVSARTRYSGLVTVQR